MDYSRDHCEIPKWRPEWDKISNAVWQTIKRCKILEEQDDEDVVEEIFFTPPQSPEKLKQSEDLSRDSCCCSSQGVQGHCTPSKAHRMLVLHDTIVGQLIYPDSDWLSRSEAQKTRSGKPKPRRLSMVYHPSDSDSPGRTIIF